MLGITINSHPYGSTVAQEEILEDWVMEETAIANDMDFEAFEELPQYTQIKLCHEYLRMLELNRNDY